MATFAGTALVGLALGAMLGGAALGVDAAARAAHTASTLGPHTRPSGAMAAPASSTPVHPIADESAPSDDADDVALVPAPSAPGAASSPERARTAARTRPAGALDSAFYAVAAGRTTGYRDGRAFALTVTMVDGKPVEVRTAAAFERMRGAAARAGLALRVVSGFRTMAHQRALYRAFRRGTGNLAALPGHSNHQSGHALDLNVTAPGVLRWLNAHAATYGFRRTVPTENWHWEH